VSVVSKLSCDNPDARGKISERRKAETFTARRRPNIALASASHLTSGSTQMVTRLLVAVAIALIAPLGAAQTAHADANDNNFIALLNSEGITDHVSPSHAIEAAHSVCQKLDGGESATNVANDVLNNSSMPAYHAGYFVGAAIKVYCPQYTPEESPADNPPKS
jgi:hypothetical protein